MYEPNSNFNYIVSVDVGIKNLALVLIEYTKEYIFNDIVWFELIDITQHVHLDSESQIDCKLFHSKTITDWLLHVMYLHNELFEYAQYIIIERQPPRGHVAIEQLLFFKYREKAILISPVSVHRFFGWSAEVNYEQRKEKSVAILKYKLEKTNRPWLHTELNKLKRQHDISDAVLQTLYFLYKKHEQLTIEKRLKQYRDNSELPFLEKFRHIPELTI